MDWRNLFLGSLIVVAFLAATGLLIQDGNHEGESQVGLNSSEVEKTEDGTKYTVHPDRLVTGCPGKDCIPSIDDPGFESGNPGWLEPDERVIGLEINGDARAYPLKILSKHEIVNDQVGGEPVAVTYCPLCRSGVAYSREVNGETLEFGVSGKLLDANLVMYDRSSETYWNQISGEAIVGPRVPQKLELKFSSITSWRDWKEGHPGTKVLSRDTGIYPVSTYSDDPYEGYSQSERVGFGVENVDDRLPAKKLVYGVKIGNESKAYTREAIRDRKIIGDEVGAKPVVIFERPDDGAITALVNQQNGEKLNLDLKQGSLEDSEERSWSFEGQQIGGNASLEKLNPRGFYWFAWSKFNPETKLYSKDQNST